jgi:protein-L-isoaspartate(D-aspartate) O-methyltransferase
VRIATCESMTATLSSVPTDTRAREMREALVRKLEELGDVSTPSVVEALRLVPREAFVPGAPLEIAYGNFPVEIGEGQTISQPTIVGQMTEALALTGHERVLEIGTGSGYQAAVLSLLSRQVYSVERIESLARQAAQRLAELGYANVRVRAGDGYRGWPGQAPFDRIIVTAAPPRIPRALVDQLAEGGLLVIPVGEQGGSQSLLRIAKRNGELLVEDLGGVRFVEMVAG